MVTVRRRLDPANPPRLSPGTEARMAAMTEEEIERNAAADPDNPPLDPDAFAETVRRVRRSTGLPQVEFAARYRINLARLRDWEQGRFLPDSVALAYLRVIETETEAVERALAG